jgi:hypothetical protein
MRYVVDHRALEATFAERWMKKLGAVFSIRM